MVLLSFDWSKEIFNRIEALNRCTEHEMWKDELLKN